MLPWTKCNHVGIVWRSNGSCTDAQTLNNYYIAELEKNHNHNGIVRTLYHHQAREAIRLHQLYQECDNTHLNSILKPPPIINITWLIVGHLTSRIKNGSIVCTEACRGSAYKPVAIAHQVSPPWSPLLLGHQEAWYRMGQQEPCTMGQHSVSWPTHLYLVPISLDY